MPGNPLTRNEMITPALPGTGAMWEAPNEVHYRIYLQHRHCARAGRWLSSRVLAAQVYRLAASVLASSSFTSRTIWRNVPRNALLSLV
jgi:hypothetical protein